MASENILANVLSEFARTLLTDFPIQAILDHLVLRIVDILPVTSAGVTLISDSTTPRYVAASDESALRWEHLQTEIGEGPCILAYESGEPVAVPDIRVEERFGVFAPAAVKAGMAAVFTFPLGHGADRLGALDLYRDEAGGLSVHDMDVAQTLADVVTAYLLNARAREAVLASADQLYYEATHDSLTGLANRALLRERLQQAARRATRAHGAAAVLFVDLDRFKLVNDTHGHRTGDELLIAVARRLAGLIRPGDTLARPSGDEFVFLCEDLQRSEDAEALAERVSSAFVAPFLADNTQHRVSASVGIAFAGPGDDISEELLLRADAAMYQAKRRGGAGHQIFDLRHTASNESLPGDLSVALRRALRSDELQVAYQPVVTGGDGSLTGVEALLRWTDPDRGPVPATTIVMAAERSELIHELGAWVLQRSCLQHTEWIGANPGTVLDLAVNVSPLQLRARRFTDVVSDSVSRAGMDPARLILEVTESSAVEGDGAALGVLEELRELGVRIALDDFGTGFSSLSYLSKLPVDLIKIDQSFISRICESARGRTVVVGITQLAHSLGLPVVAEGVESAGQAAEVRDVGCDLAQGFYYARPTSAAAIGSALSQAVSRRVPALSALAAANALAGDVPSGTGG